MAIAYQLSFSQLNFLAIEGVYDYWVDFGPHVIDIVRIFEIRANIECITLYYEECSYFSLTGNSHGIKSLVKSTANTSFTNPIAIKTILDWFGTIFSFTEYHCDSSNEQKSVELCKSIQMMNFLCEKNGNVVHVRFVAPKNSLCCYFILLRFWKVEKTLFMCMNQNVPLLQPNSPFKFCG